jgi:hypothetical protein
VSSTVYLKELEKLGINVNAKNFLVFQVFKYINAIVDLKIGLGKVMSLLSVTFRPIFIAINRKNSGNSFVTLYVQRDLN